LLINFNFKHIKVDENVEIPETVEERHKTMLKYYQWIHLIILLQCGLYLVKIKIFISYTTNNNKLA